MLFWRESIYSSRLKQTCEQGCVQEAGSATGAARGAGWRALGKCRLVCWKAERAGLT